MVSGSIGVSEYPSMIIDGSTVEKFDSRPCRCGMPTTRVGVRSVGIEDKYGHDRLDGRTIKWSRGDQCASCEARQGIAEKHQSSPPRLLDRGVRRADVQAAAEHNRASGSAIGSLTAEVLDELLAEIPGDRITKAVMRSNRFGNTIEPVITNLPDDASPVGAMFATGPVRLSSKFQLPVTQSMIYGFIDRHTRGDFGDFGPIPTRLSDQAAFAIVLGSVPEQNFEAISSRCGLIRSFFKTKAAVFSSPIESRDCIINVYVFTFINEIYTYTELIAT